MLAAEEQAVLLAVEAKKRAWLAELKAHMEQDLEVCVLILVVCKCSLLQLRAMKKQEEHDEDVAWLKSLQEKEAALDELDKKALETARSVLSHKESIYNF